MLIDFRLNPGGKDFELVSQVIHKFAVYFILAWVIHTAFLISALEVSLDLVKSGVRIEI